MGFLHQRSIFSTPFDSEETDPCTLICKLSPRSRTVICYHRCPLTPPPPPPPFHFDHQSNQFKYISPLVIIIATILGCCFLLICYFAIFLKYFSSNNNSRRSTSTTQLDETNEDFFDENHGPMVDHPIWFITTVGLEQSVINSIAVCKYKKGDGLIEGTECSVCLNEFQEDENLRLLPKCSHAFHLPCIDTWLRSHTNCPLCRAGLFSNPVGSNSTPMGSNMNNSGSGEEIRGENSESDDGLRSDESIESAVSVHDEGELVDGRRTNIEITKENLPSPLENSEFRVVSDLGENHRVVDKGIQPGRRSVSLDFSPASMFCFSISNSLPIEGEGSSPSEVVGEMKSKSIIVSKSSDVSPNIFRLMGSSSKGMRMLQKGPVSMKRSLSSSGKFLSSRYGRNRNSILPL